MHSGCRLLLEYIRYCPYRHSVPDRLHLPPGLYQRVRMHTMPDELNLEQRRVHSGCRLLQEHYLYRYHHLHSVPDRFNLHCRRYQLELVYSNCRLLRIRCQCNTVPDVYNIRCRLYQLGRVHTTPWIRSEYNYTGNICLPGRIYHWVKNIYARVRYIVAATVQIAPTRRPPSP